MRAVGYVRISKADRDKSEEDQRLPIKAQCEAIERTAESEGWELLNIYEDFSVTGAHMRRGELKKALAHVESGDAEVLVIARLDRLSRNARDLLNLLFDSEKQGWSIWILNDRIDTATATGWLHAALQAVFAEYERRLIGERTKAALAIKALTMTLGRPVKVTSRARDLIVELAGDGMTPTAIARELNARKVKPPTKRGKRWHHSVVIRVLEREQVA